MFKTYIDDMKNKRKIIIISIIVLIIIITIFGINSSSKRKNSRNFMQSNIEGTLETKATIQTIENTLSNSGQVSSALQEKLYLHASYYFESMLVDENVFVEEGTNIIEYTNGTYLTAPYDLVITSKNLPEEDAICSSSHYIEVNSIETLSMNLSISETDINKVEIGDPVDITVTSSNEKLQGYITSISEVGTYSSSGSYFTSVVTFENNGNLKIGMSATCEIFIERAENVVAVPLEAVQTSDEGSYVIVVNEDGTTTNTMVETGISNEAYIEIKSGITENTTVQMEEASNESGSFGGGNGRMNNFGGGMERGGQMEMPSGGMPSGMSGGMPSMPSGM